jgi:hypothetical protein
VLAADEQCARQAAEHADAQPRRLLAQGGRRPLQQLHRDLVGDHGAPARVLVADRGAREQLRRVGDLRRLRERRERVDRPPRAVPRQPQLDQQLGALRRIGDPELERDRQALGRLVERQRARRGAGGEDVVGDAPSGAGERRGRREVVRELCRPGGPGRLQRLADAQVQLRAAHGGQPVIQCAPHQLVREAVGQPHRGELLDHAAVDGLVERAEDVRLAGAGRAQDAEAELRARDRGELEQIAGRRLQPGEPPADDLAHTLRAAQLGQRADEPQLAVDDLDHVGVD